LCVLYSGEWGYEHKRLLLNLSRCLNFFGLVQSQRIVFLSTFISCWHPNTTVRSSAAVQISLEVSPALRTDLQAIEKNRYTLAEADKLFAKMYAPGDEFCRMVFGKRLFTARVARRHIATERVMAYLKGIRSTSFLKFAIKSGCWNFYRFNDGRPETALKAVGKLYGKVNYSCASVGFMQPYIMHNILGCYTLTMVDIDWRIIDAHRQMYHLFRRHQFESQSSIPNALLGLHLGWHAKSGKLQPQERIESGSLCPPQKLDFCLITLQRFQQEFSRLRKIRLNLSALADLDLHPLPDSTIVVYLSNSAIAAFMSSGEFLRMVNALGRMLRRRSVAVLVHHESGSNYFEIFELRKEKTKVVIRLRCSSGRRQPGRPDSYLFKYAEGEDRKAPVCLQ